MAREGSVAPKERINVTFKPAIGGAQEEIELPLKLLVLGDFIQRVDERKLEDRKSISIDKNNFDDVMAKQALELTLSVPNRLQAVGPGKAVRGRGRKRAIDNDQLLAARYVLCTVVDEAVLNTSWGSKSDWSKISLLSRFHKETFGGEKFFQLLERLSTNPFKRKRLMNPTFPAGN
ncbi:hypothetical protein F2S68_22585 [Pseudomonas syringae pv. actinidiae]|nr:hypothetical protein [Pseudomonas syringae pv. actinidiae]